MVSWMKERKGIKRQMHFSNNWVRYCSLWEAVVAGGEKIGWGRCTIGSPIPQSHPAGLAGLLGDGSSLWVCLLRHTQNPLKSYEDLLGCAGNLLGTVLPWYSPSKLFTSQCHASNFRVSRGLCVPPGFPADLPLCARAVLCFPSLSFTFPQCCGPDCALLPLYPFTVSTQLLVLNIFPQHLKGFPEAPMPRHVPALFPLDSSKPLHCLSLSLSWTRSLSLYCLQHDWVDSLNPKQASLPSMMGEAPLLPHCHYFPPEVTHKLLWVFKWAVISSFHQHSLTLDSRCRFSFNEFIGMTRYTGDAKVDNLIHQALLSFSHLHYTFPLSVLSSFPLLSSSFCLSFFAFLSVWLCPPLSLLPPLITSPGDS